MSSLFKTDYLLNRKILLLFCFFTGIFSAIAQPTITSFSPKSGAVGSSVTLTGTNFNSTYANNAVFLGGVKCTITAASTTSLTVTIPTGANTGKFNYTNITTAQTTLSGSSFGVKFANTFGYVFNNSYGTNFTISTGNINGINGNSDKFDLIDINDDKKNDLILYSGNGTATLNTFINSSTTNAAVVATNFTNTTLVSGIGISSGTASAVVTGDFDGDGLLDLFGSVAGYSGSRVFKNTTTSGTPSVSQPTYGGSSYTSSPNTLDFNKDGKLDIISHYSSSGYNAYYHTNSTGASSAISFTYANTPTSSGASNKNIRTADLNKDGYDDIVFGDINSNIYFNKNTSGSSWALSNAYTISGTSNDIQLYDLDGNGYEDIISSNSSSSLNIFPNITSGGTFALGTRIDLSTTNTGGLRGIALADFNNDGLIDIVVSGNSNMSLFINTSTSGSISFASAVVLNTVGIDLPTIKVVDLNNDGFLEIIGHDGYSTFKIYSYLAQPTITSTTSALTAFTKCSGSASTEQNFSVAGSNLTVGISIAALTGFEYSLTSNGTYTATLTVGGAGTIASTPVYVRMQSTANNATYTAANIVLSSTNATSVNVSASGTVNPAAVGGTIAGSTTVCSGTNRTTLTLSGYTGTITKWQSSTSSTFASGITDIAKTLPTYFITNLSATTYYRAVITNGSCSANSAIATITVNATPASVAGSISGAAAVCSGTNSTTLSLVGNTGTIQWQSSINNSSFSNIPNETTSSYTAQNLTAVTYYRAVVTSGTCTAENTSSVTMSVTVTPVVTNKTATVCSGETFTVAPTTGSGNTVPSGTTYTWTVADNANVTGESAVSISQSSISQTLTNTSSSNQTVVYTVTPKNTLTGSSYAVGSPFNGGVIAYIFQPGDNGYTPGKVLIVKDNFVPLGSCTDAAGWIMQSATASTSALIGEGLNNTNNLFAAGHTNTSQAIGYIYNYTDGIYSDWFAPSIDELTAIFNNAYSSLPTYSQTSRAIRSSTEIPTSLGQTYAFMKNSNNIGYTTTTQNDGGCGMVILSRYDTLPTTICDGATFTVTVTVTNNTWLGTTSTAWNTTTNWSCGAVPTATSNVIIASSSNQPIISSNVSINSLTINSGTSLTVNSGFNLTVTNAVSNSGTLTLQNNANLLQDTATTTNSNTGSIVVKRNSSSLLRLDHTLWSSPVASQNLFSFSPSTLTNRFYIYDTAANAYATTGLSAATTFVAGKGYAVRAPNNHSSTSPTTWTGTFTGVPNNGTVPFTLDTASSGYNLVGNPYPSPINASAFLTENTSKIDGTLYFYAHSLTMNTDGTFPSGTNYCSWNTTAGVAATTAASGDFHPIPVTPNGIIQVGQGFFVKATAAGSINFTNAMRVSNNANQFLRTNELEKHRLWLNLTTENDTDINQIAVAYVEGATQGVDSNFDGLSFGNTGSSLSSKINNDDYVIQGRSLPFDSNDVVSLGFKAASAGNYKIKLTDKDELFLGNQDVFVRDNLMGVEHNIKVAPYTFASQAGTFDNRFQLVYTQVLGNPSTTFTPNAVNVYKTSDGFLVTANGIVMKDIHVYDISGRLIFKQTNINGTTTVLKGLSQTKQVLLLKITSQENETVTVKAIN